MPVKVAAATFEVNMANQSLDNTKKHFQRQLTISPHIQTLAKEKYLTFFLRRNTVDDT